MNRVRERNRRHRRYGRRGQTALTSPGHIWILVAMIAAAFTTELTFRVTSRRKLRVFKSARFN